MGRMRYVLAWIRAGRAEQNSLRVPRPAKHAVTDHHIVAAFDERISRSILDQMRVPVEHTHNLDVIPQEGSRGRRDHSVGSGCGTTGKKNRNAVKIVPYPLGTGHRGDFGV